MYGKINAMAPSTRGDREGQHQASHTREPVKPHFVLVYFIIITYL